MKKYICEIVAQRIRPFLVVASVLSPISVITLATAQTTDYATWTGAGMDTLFSNPDNWQDGLLPDNTGFAGVNFGAVANRTVTLDADYDLSFISFSSFAGSYNIQTSNGSVLAFALINAQDPSATHSFDLDMRVTTAHGQGTVQTWFGSNGYHYLNFNGALDNQGSELNIRSRGPKAFNGVIFGAGGINTNGFDFADFSAANTFTGSVRIARGGLSLVGDSGAFLGTTNVLVTDTGVGDRGRLIVGDAAATAANPNRINNAATVALKHGHLELIGSNNAATTSEFINTLAIQTGSNRIDLNNATNSGQVELVGTSAVTREAGGYLWLNAADLGGTGANSSRLLFGVSPNMKGGGGADGTQSVSIIPWLFRESGSAGALTTYGPNGVRFLDMATEYAMDFIGPAGANVRLESNASLSTDATVNALWMQFGTSLTISDGKTLGVDSGVLSLARNARILGGALDFGNENGVIAISGGAFGAAEISASIRGTNGLETNAVAHASNYGANALRLSGVNDYTGTTRLGTHTTITNSDALGASREVILDFGGTLALEGNISLQKDLTIHQAATSVTNGLASAKPNLVAVSGDSTLDGELELQTEASIAVLPTASLNVTGQISSTGFHTLYADVGASANLTFSGGTSGSEKLGHLYKTGDGELFINAASSVSSTLNVSGGKMQITDAVDVGYGIFAYGLGTNPQLKTELEVVGPMASLTGRSYDASWGRTSLHISAGGEVDLSSTTLRRAEIGGNSGSQASVVVEDVGSRFNVDGQLQIGVQGNGSFKVQNGATAEADRVEIAVSSAGYGLLEVSGDGSAFTALGVNSPVSIHVGGSMFSPNGGQGEVHVHGGGKIVAAGLGLAVHSNGKLWGGGGTVEGDVTNNGLVAPGNSLGTLSIVGRYAELSTGFLEIELGGAGAGLFDVLSVTGDVALAGTLDVSLINNFQLSLGQTFQIIQAGGTVSGQFNGLGEGDIVGNFGGHDLFITYSAQSQPQSSGNGVALYTAVPEPGSLGLLGLGGLFFLRRRRRGNSFSPGAFVAVIAVAAVGVGTAGATTWQHTAGGSQNWDTGANWTGVVPNGVNAVAEFKSPGAWPLALSVARSGAITLGTLNVDFGTNSNLNISTSNSTDFTFQKSSGSATLTTTQSNPISSLHITGRNIVLNSNLTVNNPGFVRFSAFNVSGGGELKGSGTILKLGAGALDLNVAKASNWIGDLNLQGGAVSLGASTAPTFGTVFYHNTNGAQLGYGNWGTKQVSFINNGSETYKLAGVFNGNFTGTNLEENIEIKGATLGGNNSALTFLSATQRVLVNAGQSLSITSVNALGATNGLPVRLGQNSRLVIGTFSSPTALPVTGLIEMSGLGSYIDTAASPGGITTLAGNIVINHDGQSNAATAFIRNDGGITSSLEITGQILDAGAGGDVDFRGPNIILHAENTYTGNTVVTSGSLLVENLSGSATGTGNVSVKSGATLGGSGQIAGDVTIASFGNLKPGSSAGTLNLLHDLTVQNFGKITFELGGTGFGDYDRIVGMNNISIAGTIELTLINGFDPQVGDSFDLMDWNGLADFSGFDVGSEFILPTLSGGKSWNTSTFQSSGAVSVVPEPGSALLLLAGLASLALRRRRFLRN